MKGEVIYVSRYKISSQMNSVYSRSKDGIYRHYGVDIGDGQVVHFRNNEGESISSAMIICTSREEFSGKDKIEKCFMTNYKYGKDEIAERALSKLGTNFGSYNLIHNNCEHFARWCASGIKTSIQVGVINDDQDIVEKAIDRTFEPLLKFGEKADNVIDFWKNLFN